MYPHAIATVSLSGDLGEKLEAIAAAGFAGVEIFESDLLTFDGDAGAVGRYACDLGLEIVAFQPFRDFEGMPEPQRSRAMERAERKFDVMQRLGTELLLVCSNVSPASLGGLDRIADDLRELGDRAARRGLRIGYEALAWGTHVNDYRVAWAAVERAAHPAVGTILDSFHILARGLDPAHIAVIPGERIFLVQIADAPLLDMGIVQWSRHFRCFPGQGRLPVDDFMQALAKTGYRGPVSLEIFNDQFRAARPRQIALDGRRSLLLAEERAARAGVPSGTVPPARFEGVEFLEFAVDEQMAADLATVLERLGFRRAGVHRSKAVELWCQGGINLVVNCDKEGFAHACNLLHGPSVCAMGLRVDDAGRAMARARAFLCEPYAGAVGPGELEIPAVRALEDSLIYLVDRHGDRGSIWEVDFDMQVLAQPASGAGALETIDHIDQVVPYGQLATWQLFYTAVCGLRAAGEYDLVDPAGLIHSQVVEAADGSIRISLSASQGAETQAGRLLGTYYGAGVQQVAFTTSDAVAAVRAMVERGVAMLPIPGNYYDDLGARFGLPEDLVQTLQRHNILYDRNDGGEFLHAYTGTFADRFSFEIVERRNYQEFGGANAAVRLAAQRRGTRLS